MSRSRTDARQVHLVAHFPGVNSQTVWSDPASGSQIDFASFKHFAQTAERGFFDYLFLAEGLRVREHGGQFHDLDVAGRPATLAALAGIAAVTKNLGVVGTLSATFNEPYELARQLATIDHLSNGRVGWNVVTSPDAFHGANFRRGGFLPFEQRYERAAEFVRVASQLWGSWQDDAILADAHGGQFLDPDRVARVDHRGDHFRVHATSTVPRSRQERPVIVQAGDSPAGRSFAASTAEVIFSRRNEYTDGQEFYRDVKGRLAAYGRSEDSLLILPGASFVIGDSAEDADAKAAEIALQQISGPTAVAWIEAIWGREFPNLDPDGPVPVEEPTEADRRLGQVSVQLVDRRARAATLRARAEAEQLTVRQLAIAETAKPRFLGTPEVIAAEIDRAVQGRSSDGFVLVPHITPHGLDEFVDRVVPLLQERGVFRTTYEVDGEANPTLRQTLGLPSPPVLGDEFTNPDTEVPA